jgi:hypothetical protein
MAELNQAVATGRGATGERPVLLHFVHRDELTAASTPLKNTRPPTLCLAWKIQ